jgi:hypothetical protein
MAKPTKARENLRRATRQAICQNFAQAAANAGCRAVGIVEQDAEQTYSVQGAADEVTRMVVGSLSIMAAQIDPEDQEAYWAYIHACVDDLAAGIQPGLAGAKWVEERQAAAAAAQEAADGATG